ncbi:DUF2290 domain-containing protein [Pectobacterium aroidearum]|uniref:DUF2290 domain-containing protein n=1 Tax=Pectobacterium aroidearum TaxID=1201031 RepID=A0AAW3SXH0_9GAMM|nr:DUF2290 domain-containing protein [Pectobacterium aroidearum]MBA5205503.1 DUF2290 domain-containing protein [Pectobacterium aroidearum]
MLTIGAFNDSKRKAFDFFMKAGVMGNFNVNANYSEGMASELRELSYTESWMKCIEKQWYDIQLEDLSLLVFKQDGYSFLMSPKNSLSYDEYVQEYFSEPEWADDEYSHLITQEFDNYIETQVSNRSVTPVRFDIDYPGFCEHTHPLYHFHFGLDNSSRIPTVKKLTPLSFSAFILRTFYPDKWKVFSMGNHIDSFVHAFKNGLESVPDEFWQGNQNNLFYFG